MRNHQQTAMLMELQAAQNSGSHTIQPGMRPNHTWKRSEKYTDRFQRRRKPATAGAPLKAASCRRVRTCACSHRQTMPELTATPVSSMLDRSRRRRQGAGGSPAAYAPVACSACCSKTCSEVAICKMHSPAQGAPGTPVPLCSWPERRRARQARRRLQVLGFRM